MSDPSTDRQRRLDRAVDVDTALIAAQAAGGSPLSQHEHEAVRAELADDEYLQYAT